MPQLNHKNTSPVDISIKPIGVVHSCFTEKFGIPRQPGLVPAATGSIELYDWVEASSLEDLDQFSHLWIFFQFHKAVDRGWKSRIRPPRLGGNKKVGVLASRSPQRPNFLGQSVVHIERINQKKGIIHISGLDLVDGTPVIDIKPYIPYTDSIPDASEGYAFRPVHNLEVIFTPESLKICATYKARYGRHLKQLIIQVLKQDPRPAYHQDDRTYGMRLWDTNIRFSINQRTITVQTIEESHHAPTI